MRFAATAIVVGLAGTCLAANMQDDTMLPAGGLAAATMIDGTVTSSVPNSAVRPPVEAIRLIDLRTGATCKLAKPDLGTQDFKAVPLGPECAKAPALSRIAYWRSTPDGSLIMADSGGGTVLEFAPGDGVLYESVYPKSELITIVPARG